MTTLLLSAGDASGDLHAAGFVEAFRRRRPGARFVGLGGHAMGKAGVELLVYVSSIAALYTGQDGGQSVIHDSWDTDPQPLAWWKASRPSQRPAMRGTSSAGQRCRFSRRCCLRGS